MIADDTQKWNKPLPAVDELSAPFWAAAKIQRLVIQRCEACKRYQFPPVEVCPGCSGSQLSWVDAAGTGTLHTFTVFHQLYHPGFADEVPYNVSVVELDEGPLMLTNILVEDNTELNIGMRLSVAFTIATDEITLPQFRPMESGAVR